MNRNFVLSLVLVLVALPGACRGGAVVDWCARVDCSGHGTCVEMDGGATCDCDEGWETEGDDCVPVAGDADTDTDTDTESDPCEVPDLDEDGYDRVECGGGDCDDGNDAIHPDTPDDVGDDTDQNCDGLDGVDADGDGHASRLTGGDDCDDGDPDTFEGCG